MNIPYIDILILIIVGTFGYYCISNYQEFKKDRYRKIKRIVLGLIGLVIGVSFVNFILRSLPLLMGENVFVFESPYYEYFVLGFIINFGIFGFKILYNYENFFGLETKHNRLHIIFYGLWFLISLIFGYFYLILDWLVFKIIVISLLVIIIIIVSVIFLLKWIDFGK